MQIILNKHYSLRSQAFSPNYLKSLEKQILLCPYLSESQLSDSFAGTKGFSVVFKHSAVEQVKQHFPFLQQYLETTLNTNCNAFYLNSLLIDTGKCIESHIDSSISSYTEITVIPTIVSVLYVQVPSDLRGGELILENNKQQINIISPKTNTLLYFRGDLKHSVSKVKSLQSRISLVCEQYNLSANLLDQIPEFKIETSATF